MTIQLTPFAKLIEDNKLSVRSEFVPFSKSRNKDKKDLSLNWKVTLMRGDTIVVTTDYNAGIADCPSYKPYPEGNYEVRECIIREVETGYAHKYTPFGAINTRVPILPDTIEVIACLVFDASVLDYADFEDWASYVGYDPDSLSAFIVYEAMVRLGLKLKAGLGKSLLHDLHEAASIDY